MEQLQALGIIHIPGNLSPDLIDIDILSLQLGKNPGSVLHCGLSEILAHEVQHVARLGRVRLAVRLDDGRGKHQKAHQETVALFGGGVAPGGRRPGWSAVRGARDLLDEVDLRIEQRPYQHSEQSPDRARGRPAEQAGYPLESAHNITLTLNPLTVFSSIISLLIARTIISEMSSIPSSCRGEVSRPSIINAKAVSSFCPL